MIYYTIVYWRIEEFPSEPDWPTLNCRREREDEIIPNCRNNCSLDLYLSLYDRKTGRWSF